MEHSQSQHTIIICNLSVVSDYDSEVFSCGGEDSDICSNSDHLCSDESRHFGAGSLSDHLADLSSSLTSYSDAAQYLSSCREQWTSLIIAWSSHMGF